MSTTNEELYRAMRSAYRAKMVAVGLGVALVAMTLFAFLGRSGGVSVEAPVDGGQTSAGEPSDGWDANAPSLEAPLADPDAPLPNGVNTAGATGFQSPYAWNYAPFKEGVKTVLIWEDFQCPACAAFEKTGVVQQLLKKADAGEINLQFRPLAFLDMNLRNDATARATAAWGCAIDAGVGEKYRELVYENQPTKEGDGFTDADLLSGGRIAGLDGDAFAQFEDCVTAGSYKTWGATSSFAAGQEIGGTPTLMVDGVIIEPKEAWDWSQLEKKLS